jgi:MYXO-CTERM domain-containing protein
VLWFPPLRLNLGGRTRQIHREQLDLRRQRYAFAIVDFQSIADSMLQNLVTSGNVGTTQQYTTIILTRTEYTTYIYSNPRSSRSQESTRSILSSMSSQSSKTSRHATSTSSSWSPSFVYHPTTLSTTTTSSVTTHSTTTVGTVVYITSTHTVPSSSNLPTRVSTSALQDTTSTTSTSAASSSTGVIGTNGERGHGSLLVSPAGSSKHSAAIAGGMTSSLAGIALIGLLFLFLVRRRKRSLPYHEKDGTAAEPRMSSSSQALPSAVAAAGSTRRSDRSTDLAPQRSRSDRLPVIDHNLIHMNIEHWDRPFAHEDPRPRDDSSPLRLMNPDPTPTPPVVFRSSSNSMSPDTASATPHGFLQRQRSALSAALLSIKRSFSSQDVVPRHASGESYLQPSAHPSAHPSPLHIQNKDTNKLTMPSEAILAGITVSRPISSQSAMSNNTIVRHQVPDDPFITSTSATPNSLLPNCPHYGHNIARRDFLAPPPLRTRIPMQSTPTHPQHGTVSPITRSNSDCSTRFESLSPTRSEISSVSVRSGPFDLATASVVDMESEREIPGYRGQREQTPNWEVHVNPGT